MNCQRCNLTDVEPAGIIEIFTMKDNSCLDIELCEECLCSMIMYATLPIKRTKIVHNQHLSEYGGKGF